MKKTYIAFSILSALASSAVFAQTAGGEVKFTGTVVEGACSILPGEENKVVPLGSIAATTFKKSGDRSTAQPFSLTLTNCTWGNTPDGEKKDKVSIVFSNTLASAAADELIANNEKAVGSAKNVGVRILDEDGEPLKSNTSADQKITEGGDITVQFLAAMEATQAKVEVGSVNATAKYVLTYQ